MEAAVSIESAPGRGKLLVVDDEENILRALRRVLRHAPWEIQTALDAQAGLSLLEGFSPDVVISDFRLPGMNGVEFLSKVKDRLPRAQRILLTGQADPHAIEAAINQSEIFRFISKPWNDAQLVLTIRSAFEQSQLLAENERLQALTQERNEELQAANTRLEEKVHERTLLLSRAKREWELAFDSLDFPLAVVTSKMEVVRANLAYAGVLGHRPEEIGQKPTCHQFLFGRKEPCLGCPLGLTIASKMPGKAEIVEGGRTYVLSVLPFPEEDRAVCTYRDVTDERALIKRSIETEKMAAVGQLAGGVAHEINNPLGGILAFAQLMRRDAGRTPQDQESLELIEESALRCKKIVQSLLQFARRSREEDRRKFDLSRCVDDAAFLFQAQLKAAPQAKLVNRLASGLPELYGNPAQLGQVVLNLLQNGLHALGGNRGTLTLETGREGERLYLQVEDEGCGIPEVHLPHIFEPSFTTKAPGEGTGLGLAIAYRIVHDHGGNFEVKSEVGKGSRFTVYLPIPRDFT